MAKSLIAAYLRSRGRESVLAAQEPVTVPASCLLLRVYLRVFFVSVNDRTVPGKPGRRRSPEWRSSW